DLERARYFPIGAGEGSRQVQVVFLQFIEIGPVVERPIEHSAIMFAGRDEDRRLAAELQIMRIGGVKPERLVRAGNRGGDAQQDCPRNRPASHGLPPWRYFRIDAPRL